MYSVTQLRRGFSHRPLIIRELNRLYHTRIDSRDYNSSGIEVMESDWDNLVILDACRYDMFEELSTLPGTLTSKESRGSNTVEFLRGNIANRDLRDTVYVTGNPQYHRYKDGFDATFHDVINVWQNDGWDSEFNTVLPETMTEYAKQASNTYPNKRLLIHYIQPHYPFLNEETVFDKQHLHEDDDTTDFWHRILYDEIQLDEEHIWEVYLDNLRTVIPHISDALDALDGKTVVTSDHGNMVGERAAPIPMIEWGHPEGIYTPELVTVPWLTYENGERRTITTDDSVTHDQSIDETVVNARLRTLGYVN